MSSHSFAATCPTFSCRTIQTLSIAPPNSASSFPSPVTRTADRFRSKFSITALVPRAIERVWIVRQENVGHVAANEWLDIRKGLLSLAVAHAFTLVIDADKVELGALESD